MKRILQILILVLCCNFSSAQNDSTGYRNYIGANINSLFTKLLSSTDGGSVRFGATYRRCLGLYNIKLSFVAIDNPFLRGRDFEGTGFDSLDVKYINYNTFSKSRDFRLGMERKWGSAKSKIYVGAGLLVGRYKETETYFEETYEYLVDSLGAPYFDRYYHNGRQDLTYLKVGFDVWAGIAWDIGSHLNLMIQYNPDISTYFLQSENTRDPQNHLYDPKEQFSWGVFNALDIMVGYRF